jgi:hypothetical protein
MTAEQISENQTNQQVLEQTSVVTVEKKKSNVLKVLILIVVFLLVGIGGVYAGMQISKKQTQIPLTPQTTEAPIISPTLVPDETANWKTYRNDKYRFEFKFPDDWSATDNKAQSPDYEADHGLLKGADFFVGINPTLIQTIEEIIEQTKKYQPNAEISNLKIKGFDAVMVSIPPAQEMGQYWPSKTIYFEKEENIFSITSEAYGDKRDFYLKILDQILSTFKFINNSDETANWKIYTNSELKYSIKYPGDWILEETNINQGFLYLLTKQRKERIDKGEIIRGCDICIKVYKTISDLPNNQVKKLNFEDWIEKESDNYGFIGRTPIAIDSSSGYQGTGSGDGESYLIFIQRGGLIYDIGTGDTIKPTEIEQKIINSLKFL